MKLNLQDLLAELSPEEQQALLAEARKNVAALSADCSPEALLAAVLAPLVKAAMMLAVGAR